MENPIKDDTSEESPKIKRDAVISVVFLMLSFVLLQLINK